MGGFNTYSKKNSDHQIFTCSPHSWAGTIIVYDGWVFLLFNEQELITIVLSYKISENIFKREEYINKGSLAYFVVWFAHFWHYLCGKPFTCVGIIKIKIGSVLTLSPS